MKKVGLLFGALMIPDIRPDVDITGFRMVESRDQRRSLELRSERASLYKKQNLSILQRLDANVFGKKGEIYLLRGDRGIYGTNQRELEIQGNAEVTTPDLYVFKTNNVTYSTQSQILLGEDAVEVTQNFDGKQSASPITLDGEGLRIDMKRNFYEILHNIVARQQVPGGKKLKILSSRLEIQPEDHKAIFYSAVKVESESFRLKGERLTIFLSNDEKKVKKEAPHAERMELDQGENGSGKVEADFQGNIFRSEGLMIYLNPDGSMGRSEAIGAAEATTIEKIQMRAEKLTSSIENGVQIIRMEGDVHIQTDKRQATCQKAYYDASKGEFLLEDIATLYDVDQQIKGEKIRFSTQNNTVIVEKAQGEIKRDFLDKAPDAGTTSTSSSSTTLAK